MITAVFVFSAALAAPLPAATAEWSGGSGRVRLAAPAGEHINAEAPARAWVRVNDRTVELSGSGLDFSMGLPFALGPSGPHELSGFVSLPLCEDGGSACRSVGVAFSGTLAKKKGTISLDVRESDGLGERPGAAPVVPADQAFEAARVSGGLVLLDFSAVWCPPCNLMAAEVLHDPENAPDLLGYSLAMVDVDQRESWELKSRYGVGGYPTLIAARPDGTEIDRLVGYPGEAEMLAWLGRVRGELMPLDSLESAELSGAEAGAAALRLARAEREPAARAVLARADEGADARIARLMLDPKVEDLSWLCERAPERAREWAFYAMDLELPSDVSARFGVVLDAAIATAEPAVGADLLYVRAGLVPEAQQASYYAAAAALLSAQLSGDPHRDKGHYTFLAELYEGAGQPEQAKLLLDQAIAAFPEEFTFHFAAAGLMLRQGRFEEALPYVEAADRTAYGDMKLRAAERYARVLIGLGRQEEAATRVNAALNAAERPAEGVNVRTTRYIGNLEKLSKELEESR